jgi:hypothetical protein
MKFKKGQEGADAEVDDDDDDSDDDEDISITEDEESKDAVPVVTNKNTTMPRAKNAEDDEMSGYSGMDSAMEIEMNNVKDDDFELSQTMKKKVVPTPNSGAVASPIKDPSIKSGSVIADEIEDDFVEESIDEEKDLLASETNQKLEFEHVKIKDPMMDKANKDIED